MMLSPCSEPDDFSERQIPQEGTFAFSTGESDIPLEGAKQKTSLPRMIAATALLASVLGFLPGCLEDSSGPDFTVQGKAQSVVTGAVTPPDVIEAGVVRKMSLSGKGFHAVDETGNDVSQIDFAITGDRAFTFIVNPSNDLNHYLLFNLVERIDTDNVDIPVDYLMSPQGAINFVSTRQNPLESDLPLIRVRKTPLIGGNDGFGLDFTHDEVVFEQYKSDLWFSYAVSDPTSSSKVYLTGFVDRDKYRWLRNVSRIPYTIQYKTIEFEDDDRVFYCKIDRTGKWVALQVGDIIKTRVLKLSVHYTEPQKYNDFGYGRVER